MPPCFSIVLINSCTEFIFFYLKSKQKKKKTNDKAKYIKKKVLIEHLLYREKKGVYIKYKYAN